MKYNITSQRLPLIVLIALSLLIISCKSTKVEQAPSVVPTQLEDALLWEISGNNLQKPSYLYGTIHIIEGADYFLPKGTLSSIEASEKMMFEIDMNIMSDMGAQMGLLNKAFMADGKTLKDLLSAEDYKIVEDHFQTMGMPLFLFERIKPMFLSVFAMGGDVDMNSLQDGSMKSYEMEFMNMAQQTGKPTGGLETVEFQLSVFDSIPYIDQARMLVDMIQTSDSSSGQFKEMITMYKNQRISEMVTSISEDPNGMGKYEDILLKQRNENWIPVMASEMIKQPTFFAVGAGHLAGEYGVIPLLMRAGYTVQPISQKKTQ